jgi:hypothetical protein
MNGVVAAEAGRTFGIPRVEPMELWTLPSIAGAFDRRLKFLFLIAHEILHDAVRYHDGSITERGAPA